MPINIAVIGAGIIGLPTAFNILKDVPNCKITVFYEEISPNTTGDVSAGFVFPYLCNGDKVKNWLKLTVDHLENIFRKPNALEIGIQPSSGYCDNTVSFTHEDTEILPYFKRITENERCTVYGEGDWWKMTTWICDCGKYLPWLTKQIKILGGKFVQRRINAFDELHEFDIIVNCAGMGAKQLTNDEKLVPIRGQVTVVKAPWLKHILINSNAYILPRLHDVVLGGTSQKGNYNTQVDGADSDLIWRECCKLNPSVQHSEIIEKRVGLRPFRDPARLELEEKSLHGKKVALLHNYGHGGSGVSLHWGCAIEASEILQKHLKKTATINKL